MIRVAFPTERKKDWKILYILDLEDLLTSQ
jgi:hypothetical protein